MKRGQTGYYGLARAASVRLLEVFAIKNGWFWKSLFRLLGGGDFFIAAVLRLSELHVFRTEPLL
jgi:hypothetical protein